MLNTKKPARRQDVQTSSAGLPASVPADVPSRAFHPYPASHELRTTIDHRRLVSDRKFIDRVVAEVRELIYEHDIQTLSFDVFDTALLREPFSEARRFYTVAETFAKKCRGAFSVTDALLARSMAARAAYAFASPAPDGTREGTLSIIATIVCSELGVPRLKNEYMKTELAFELGALSPNPLVVQLLKSFPKLKAIFLSDMYLESNHIRTLLEPVYGKGVKAISSADGHGSKRCGGLFRYAAEHFGISAGKTLHFGDSLESDFRKAKRAGFQAYFLPISDDDRTARGDCYRTLATQLAPSGVRLESFLSFNC